MEKNDGTVEDANDMSKKDKTMKKERWWKDITEQDGNKSKEAVRI